MRNKNKSKTFSPHPSLLPWFNFTPDFSTSFPQGAPGNREWGLQSVHHTLSLLLLPPQGEDSSHSSHAPAWGLSHRRQSSTNSSNMSSSHRPQFFTNCCSVGPFYRVQSFRNGLLQHGFLKGHKSCQVSAPVWAFQRVTASFRHIHLLHCAVLHGLQGTLWSSPQLQGNLCSAVWSILSPFLLH